MLQTLDYTARELMAICCAREIQNGELVFVGIGLPMIAAQVAQATTARDSVFVYETGGVGAVTSRLPCSVMDNPTTERALTVLPMWRVFGDAQAGLIHRGILGGAQIDRFGNLNSTVIGAYDHPTVRLAGSGGANDIASSCKEVTIVIDLKANNFVERVDFITSVGHLEGNGSRHRAGLTGNGPTAVITQMGVFRFESDTGEMMLDEVFPGVEPAQIDALIPWRLRLSPALRPVAPPTADVLAALRSRDPHGELLDSKRFNNESFQEFYIRSKRAPSVR